MKQEPTVIESEAVEKTNQATEAPKTQQNTAEKTKQNKQAAKRSKRADWLARGLAIAALGGVAWLWGQQGQMTELVEAQNALNARVQHLEEEVNTEPLAFYQHLDELRETVESLSTEVDALNEKVLNPANELIVTKGEVELLKKQLLGMQQQLQSWAQRWQQALQNLQTPQARDQEAEPSDADTVSPALSQLEQQLRQMGRQLGQLFSQLQTPAETQPQGDMPQLPSATGGVDPMTLQQWLLRTNTEWLLTADVALTKERLHSLEQLVQLSELPNESKIKLLRAIGQDLAYLEQYAQTEDGQQIVVPLKQWVLSLVPEKPLSNTEQTQSSSQTLAERLKGLVEIRKRDEGLSTPEQWMAFDLSKQRALLLLDQLQWAYTTHNVSLFEQTQQRLQQLFKQALPAHVQALDARLAKLPKPQRPQPLKSAEAL